ncbi:carbohydrate kinase family protein [Aliiglaciecola lipolytica]|uniref:Fructokinase n=1 Tax=Aliiglaciecola lipolytica E3 TaxID=1127673 RepID=K6YQX8_9ALTE|nr:carbohydrate kinase [Aliiglaciecola lipolytica]GAC13720.1 fructokinase [Aliiglaciecola lipolytica E3]
MKKIVCVGEMLIDFVCTDSQKGLHHGGQFTKKPGGAPANVAACVGKLGGKAIIVSSVGRDPFGDYLINVLQNYQVNTTYVQHCDFKNTTLAFVSLSEDGERDFVFSRGADEQLTISDATMHTILDDSIVHLGSATALLGGPLADAYAGIAKAAKKNGNLICFDPNYRSDLWKYNLSLFQSRCDEILQLADIVKVSEEEILLLSSQEEIVSGCDYLHQKGIKIVLVTLGSNGCLVSYSGSHFIVPAYETNVMDTTGAGDSFIGAMLYQLATLPVPDDFYASKIKSFVEFAEKVSSLVCSKLGAMTALPTSEEVNLATFNVILPCENIYKPVS